MLDAIRNLLPGYIWVIILGAAPISELRGALPYAIVELHYVWYDALFLSILGNMLPVPFLLLFWNAAKSFLSRIAIFKKPLEWLFRRTQSQSASIGKYKFWGLLVFVAVPVPFTGAWTASLVAVVLGMKFWPAFWSILGGVIVAGIIVTALSLMGWTGLAISIASLVAITVWSLRRNGTGAAKEKLKP